MNSTIAFIFVAATQAHGLPPNLLASICYVESKYDINAVHQDDGGTDSLGLCQIKYTTAQWMGFEGTEEDLMKPGVNAYYAAKYLKHNLTRYHGDITKAVIAYNRGSAGSNVTTEYSDKVLKVYRGYYEH